MANRLNKDEYKKDLAQFKKDVELCKTNFFSLATHIDKMTSQELTDAGYGGKTKAEAIYIEFVDTKKKISKITQAFLVKYPD